MLPNLSELETLARQAGEILITGFGQRHQVTYKSLIDPVTEVDRLSEDFLIGEVRARFPSHRIITEETGEHAGQNDHIWYIDPLDGTVNFAHQLPIFAVSLAYVQAGVIQAGVVFAPLLNECFTAQRGGGAWLNGDPLHVSSPPDLDHSLLVTGFPYDIRTSARNNLDQFARFSLHSQGVRRLGSAALDLCYVAAGRFDGYWEMFLQPWDVAAGALIAYEAGAMVARVGGEPVTPEALLQPPCSVLAAGRQIHAQMRAVLSDSLD